MTAYTKPQIDLSTSNTQLMYLLKSLSEIFMFLYEVNVTARTADRAYVSSANNSKRQGLS